MTAATLVAGCDQEAADPGSGPDANTSQLRFGNGKSHVPGFGLAQAYVPADQPVAMSTYTLCTVDGPVSITDIELKEAENLTLVDWGVRDYPPVGEDLGVWNGEVLGDATFSQAPVPGSCHSPKHLSELDISAQMSQEGIGIAHGFDVVTTDGTLFAPMRIILCPAECPDGPLNSDFP